MRLTPVRFLRQLFATRTKRTLIATVCALAVGAAAAVVVTMYVRADPPANRTSAGDTDASTGAPGARPESASLPASPSASGSVSASASASASAAAGARPPGGWPGPGNTGPRGTKLSNYGGPCTITAARTVIDSKTINCDLLIKATGVVIRKSKVNGRVNTDDRGAYSVTIEDTEVNAGTQRFPAVAYSNVTVVRSNIHGGQTSVLCVNSCTIRDSWLHGQYMPPGADWHLDAFLMNGGSDATLVHNTLDCQNPDDGCSAAVGLFGDFSPVSRVTLDGNLFVANKNQSYCAYGGSVSAKPYQADHIVFRNNVFQRGSTGKCAYHGAITSFDPNRSGNVWANNKYDDGRDLASSH